MTCPSCGAPNAADAGYCSACGAALTAAPAAPPAPQTTAAKPASEARTVAGFRIASLGDRLIALILDTILMAGVFAVAGMWAAARWGGVTESGFELNGRPALVAIGAVLLVGFIYAWLLEGLFGATIGKGIVGIRVRDENGARCGLGPSLVRNILRCIDGLAVYLVGFLIALFSKKRQRLGDHLAHTVVVETGGGAFAKAVLVLIWLALLGGSIWGAYVIHHAAPASATVAPAPSSTAATVPPSTPVLTSGNLQVINFAFLQQKEGAPRGEGPYKRGDEVYTRYEIAGFTTDSQGQIHLVDSAVPLDPNGLEVYAPWKNTTDRVSGETKTVKNSFWFDLPPYAPAGTYKVLIKVHDNVKNTDTEQAPTFTVEAPPLPASTKLEIRDLQLSLSENGPPANPPALQPGGTVYMSGKVAGIQFRDDKADTRLAFQVFGPNGQKLLDNPNFLTLNDAYPYHPPTFFINISGHLTLPSDAAKGSYTEKYTLTDAVSNATANYELKFEVP